MERKIRISQDTIDQAVATVRGSAQLMVLFGSQARGDATDSSDVDVALWRASDFPPLEKLELVGRLSQVFGDDVSVVFLSPTTDPVLGKQIEQDGVLLFEEEQGLWTTLKLGLFHRYVDTAPLRKLTRKALLSEER